MWIISASCWLFTKKSITMHGYMNVKYVCDSYLSVVLCDKIGVHDKNILMNFLLLLFHLLHITPKNVMINKINNVPDIDIYVYFTFHEFL
jgi:hypothetical protein